MVDRWYNSTLANYTGIGIAAFGILSGMGSCAKGMESGQPSLYPQTRVALELAKNKHRLQIANIMGDPNIPEKFYTIDGKIAIVEIDGKLVLEKRVE